MCYYGVSFSRSPSSPTISPSNDTRTRSHFISFVSPLIARNPMPSLRSGPPMQLHQFQTLSLCTVETILRTVDSFHSRFRGVLFTGRSRLDVSNKRFFFFFFWFISKDVLFCFPFFVSLAITQKCNPD